MRVRLNRLIAACCAVLALNAASANAQTPAPRATLVPPLKLPGYELPALDEVFASRPFSTWVEEWAESRTAERLAAPRQFLLQSRTFAHYDAEAAAVAAEIARIEQASGAAPVVAATDTVEFLPPIRENRARENLLGGTLGEYADLGLRIRTEGTLGGAWTRHKPCDPVIYFNCNPGMFPELKPDVQFGIVVGGTISERVHLDVDYDQTREFDAANNINVYYQGLADEILQRVEVGDVSIRLPQSRYLTRGVPAGNFGFMASAQLGPLDVQTVFAEQKGDVTTREFKFGGGTSGVEQDAEVVLDDADYAKGQFFFIVPPSEIPGSPHIDVLALLSTDAPASIRPGLGGNIQVYRDERVGVGGGASQQVGRFLAEAQPPGGGQRHTGSFARLIADEHYVLHPSGLWLMLKSPLRADEALAISYVTETGDTVGTLNAESTPPGTTPTLMLLRGPVATHQPGTGTWEMEMHQVYRLDSSNSVDLNSVDLQVSLGELAGGRTFRDVLGQQLSFLKFFGLDEDSPADRIDAAHVYQPSRDAFGGTTGSGSVSGTYIVFPTLRPFADPAPLQSIRASAEELRQALGQDANAEIYDNPDPVNRDAAGRFRLNFSYRVKVEGLQSSFNLGAFGLREGSERLRLAGRQLQRGIDYDIDYEIGLITLLDPATLFATSPDAQIEATWEQKPMFAIAPRTTFGASARFAIGARGELNFVGLFQREKSLISRPQLGMEPGGAFLGGIGGSFDLGGQLLDRAVAALGMRSATRSSVKITGELALSAQNSNRAGVAYLDDFEVTDEVALSVRRQDWKLGSAAESSQGDRGTLPFVLDAASALPLVWQDRWLENGQIQGALPARTWIDREIVVAGGDQGLEGVMWLTWGWRGGRPPQYPEPLDARRWRSLTTVLSTTGRDMTRSEYLEFYVSAGANEPLALIFDIGTVSEDAFYVDSLGRTQGIREDGRPWGLRTLDAEANPLDREVWGTDRDALGLWDQPCVSEPLATYGLGDPRANCTRNNGFNDTEDLNGNGILDGDDGQYFRYVVQLDQNSEYLVRDTEETGTGFRLYRLPLRSGTPVNGANEGTWRFIRHLRMTIAGEPTTVRQLSLARMRIVGSRWTKRDVHGIMRGNFDAEPGAGALLGEVRVGPVSRLTDGLDYEAPPGVNEELQDRSQQYGTTGFEINEKSLRIAYDGLQPDERAEVYHRYPQQPRNLLEYGELRLWALARRGDWGPDGSERFSVRVGTDPNNFYLYQTKLRPATGPRQAVISDWLPELVIDVNEWLALKAEAERRLVERGPDAARDTLWSADSAYAVVLQDRARAPNLAAVRELVFAVYNAGDVPTDGEVWIDDMRLGLPDRTPDTAGTIGIDVVAGDLMTASVTLSNQGATFRQMNETPSYVQGRDLNINTETRLGRLLPQSWGVELPVSIAHSRTDQTPTFLQQSDVLADRLDGLRESGYTSTRIGARIAKRTPTANPLLSLLLDGSQLRVAYNTGVSNSVTNRAENRGFTGDLSYRRDIAPRSLPLPWAGLLAIIAPEPIENSAAFQRLAGARLRWTPSVISFGSSYSDQLSRTFRYERILELPGDTSATAIESPRQALRNDVTLGLQPFQPLTLSLGLSSDRDLLDIDRATSRDEERQALERELWAPGGLQLGWERARALNTTLNYRPEITAWLRASYTFTNRYITSRTPSYIEFTGDSVAQMQRRFESSRQTSRSLQFLPRHLPASLALDSAHLASRLLRRLDVVDVTWRNSLGSSFDRELFLPGFGYQLGLGDANAFRVIGSDTATRAQQRDEFRASSAVQVLRSSTLTLGYTNNSTETWDARGGARTVKQVGWPSLNLAMRELPVPSFAAEIVSGIDFGIGVQRNRESTLITGTEQLRKAENVRIPFNTRIGFLRGVSFSYRGSIANGETLDPTGDSRSASAEHNVALTGVLQVPERMRARFTQPFGLSLRYTDTMQRLCRFGSSVFLGDGCVSYVDVATRSLNFGINSRVNDVQVDLDLSYVNRANLVGTRAGSSQFQLNLRGSFMFEAGQVPTLLRR